VADSAAADGPAGGPWNPETTSDRLPTAISIPSTSPRFISSLQKSLVSRFSHWILPFTSEQVTTGVLPLLSDSPLRFCPPQSRKTVNFDFDVALVPLRG